MTDTLQYMYIHAMYMYIHVVYMYIHVVYMYIHVVYMYTWNAQEIPIRRNCVTVFISELIKAGRRELLYTCTNKLPYITITLAHVYIFVYMYVLVYGYVH